MVFSYFKNRSWEEISREERLFCSHLYFYLRNNPTRFLKFLCKINIIGKKEVNKSLWESAFEVCFYRDIVSTLGYNGTKKIGETKFNNVRKRTFDLCLFSEDHIIIIEAKAHGGFDTEQMTSFINDLSYIRDFIPETTQITLIGLVSSKYTPKESTQKNFAKILNWKQDIYNCYTDPIFLRADDVFRK